MFTFYSSTLIWLWTLVEIGYWFCLCLIFLLFVSLFVCYTRKNTPRSKLDSSVIEHAWFFGLWEENHEISRSLCVWCVFKYLSSPNSNFPGPFLRKLPLIHVGIAPLMAVGIGWGVSSPEVTRAAKLSSPLACGQRCQLGTTRKLSQNHVLPISTNLLSTPPQASPPMQSYEHL